MRSRLSGLCLWVESNNRHAAAPFGSPDGVNARTSRLHQEEAKDASQQVRALQTARMSVRAELPADAVVKSEPNIVTAPGLPGSTDKGDQQQRGQRLAATTAKPVKSVTFRWQLEF